MAHPRKLIRQAVVALLVAAGTAAGERVQPTRVDPSKKGKLPAIGVYTLSDSVEEDASTELEDTHTLELEIAGFVKHTDALPADDAMDDLAEQIEAAMAADQYLGGKAADCQLVGSLMEIRAENGASDPLVGIIVLTYAVTYRADLTADPAGLDDFISVAQSTQTTDSIPDDTVPASDEFIVQEIAP